MCKCCLTWTSTLPVNVKLQQAIEKETNQTTKEYDNTFAMVHRHNVHGTTLRPLSIEIENARLKE